LLREMNPVCRLADGRYVLSRYEDVLFAIKRYDLFTIDLAEAPISKPTWLADDCKRSAFLLEKDPPESGQYRAIINNLLFARSVKRLSPWIREIADRLIVGLRESGKVDFLADFAYPYIAEVQNPITGLQLSGPQDIHKARHWIDLVDSLTQRSPDAAQKIAVEALIRQQNKEFHQLIRDRRNCPRNDVASALANATINNAQLTEDELYGAFNLFAVTRFQPATVLANAVAVLGQRPDLLHLLRATPDRIGAFIEELLRFNNVPIGVARVTTTTVSLHGITIPPNSPVLLLTSSANRDPAQFERPNEFQLERGNIRTHLAFGHGPHFCIGAGVARLQMKIALEALLSACSKIECPPDSQLDWNLAGIIRSLRTLPIHIF
jgi:cytochrome P450